jgi:uncharacterized membrane protein
MSQAIYTNAALATALLAAVVKAAESWRRVSYVAITRGGRSALCGAVAAALALAVLIALLLPEMLSLEPSEQHLLFGTWLLVTGMRWMRKAILWYAAAYTAGTINSRPNIRKATARMKPTRLAAFDYLGFLTAFRICIVNGFPIVAIPIALGYSGTGINEAGSGSVVGVLLVVVGGLSLRRTLTEGRCNRVLFSAGALVSAFGTFWTADGLGFQWPASDLIILILAFAFWITGWAAVMRKCVDPNYTPVFRFGISLP